MYDDNNSQRAISPKAIRLIILCVVGLILLLILNKILSTSVLDITVNGTDVGNISYSLLNQAGDNPTIIKSSESHIKRYVSHGNYEVLVTQDGKSYFRVVHTHGFFGKTEVTADLASENARSFIGNNPGACMTLTDNVLLSYACGGPFQTLTEHVPATPSSPSINQPADLPDFATTIGGTIQTSGATWALLDRASSSDPVTSPVGYSINKLNSDMTISRSVALPALDAKATYSVVNYQKGFLVYNSAFTQLFYYPNIGSKPQQLHVTAPAGKNLRSVSLSVSGSSIALTYTNAINAGDAPASADGDTVITTFIDSVTYSHTLKGSYAHITMCSETQLCVVNNKLLTVYDVSNGGYKDQFSISDVNNISNLGADPLLITSTGVMKLDIASQSAYLSYSFGTYSYCGIQTTPNGYLVCIRDAQSKTEALLVDPAKPNVGSIDKKIANIQKTPEIDTLSVYGNYITVATKGPIVYNPTTRQYGPDPDIQKPINDAVTKAIKDAGIDTKQYTLDILGP